MDTPVIGSMSAPAPLVFTDAASEGGEALMAKFEDGASEPLRQDLL